MQLSEKDLEWFTLHRATTVPLAKVFVLTCKHLPPWLAIRGATAVPGPSSTIKDPELAIELTKTLVDYALRKARKCT